MEAMEELSQLSETIRQAASLLADDDPSDDSAPRRPSTFLNAVVLGNVGAGKSAVLNSLIGHAVLPTGENGATRAPIVVDLQREPGLSTKSIVLQIDSKAQQVSSSALRHSLQDRLSKGSGRGRADEISLKLRTSTAPSLKLIDLPGLDQRVVECSMAVSHPVRKKQTVLLLEENQSLKKTLGRLLQELYPSLLYRIKQRGFLEMNLVLDTWVEQHNHSMDEANIRLRQPTLRLGFRPNSFSPLHQFFVGYETDSMAQQLISPHSVIDFRFWNAYLLVRCRTFELTRCYKGWLTWLLDK